MARRGRGISLGRYLSWVLRHAATSVGLNIDYAGGVSRDDLIHHLHLQPAFQESTFANIEQCVIEDKKGRFALYENDGIGYIRAVQGHSKEVAAKMKADAYLETITEPLLCIHGTSSRAWDSIKVEGLKTMTREYIHCAPGLPGDGVISGMRKTAEVFLYLDTKKMIDDNIKILRAENGVLLTKGIDGVLPVDYFAKIIIK
jgi:2'-phosphotransferase